MIHLPGNMSWDTHRRRRVYICMALHNVSTGEFNTMLTEAVDDFAERWGFIKTAQSGASGTGRLLKALLLGRMLHPLGGVLRGPSVVHLTCLALHFSSRSSSTNLT